MARETISIGEMNVDQVYNEAISNGVAQADAAFLVGSWILEQLGNSKRTFRYNQDMDRVDPACQAEFNRSFNHSDWVDGESVVQAEVTAGEEGFNKRFHDIENDFDGLESDVDKMLACLSLLRTEVFQRFEEVKLELNRINSDIHDCCHKDNNVVGGNFPALPGVIGTGQFLGTTQFNDREMSMWSTAQGYMMLPSVYTTDTNFIQDERVQNAGYMARFIADNAEVTNFFDGNSSTREEFMEKFGQQTLGNGKSVRSSLEILPTGAKFESAKALINEMAEREASALRTRSRTDKAVAEAFGFDAQFNSVKDAPVERFGGMPNNARRAIIGQGITTMAELESVPSLKLLEIMREGGVQATPGDVAEWQATAKTLIKIK